MSKYNCLSFPAVMAGFIITQFSTTLVLPILPTLVIVLHSSIEAVMFVLSMFFFGYAIGQLTWGSLSDYFGRKPMMLISLMFYIVLSFAIVFIHQLFMFYLIYALLGLQAAAYTSVGNAILKDLYGKNVGIFMGIVGVAMASGAFLGPLSGGALLRWFGWQSIFITLCVFAIFSLLGFCFFVPETHDSKQHRAGGSASTKLALGYLWKNASYLSYILVLGLTFAAYYGYLDASPFIFENYLHLSQGDYQNIFPLVTLSFFLGSIFVMVFVKRFSSKKIVYIGILTSLSSAFVFFVFAVLQVKNLFILFLPNFILLFGFGVLVPITKIGSMLSVDKYNGTASSMMKFIQTVFAFIGISIVAKIHSSHSITLICLMLLLLVTLSLVLFKKLN